MWVARSNNQIKSDERLWMNAVPAKRKNRFLRVNQSKGKFVKKYFLAVSVCMVPLLLSWFFLPQQMSNALIPFVVLLLYRSFSRYQQAL